MPSLALAGGTSASLGRAITTSLLSSKSSTSWTVVILSRTPKIPLWLQAIDPKSTRTLLKVVDYTSPDSLASALKGVDTLISVTSAVDGTRVQTEINLLHAAISAGCRRFAPSAWGFGPKSYESGLLKYINEGIWEACVENQDKIECARFNIGMFMNYFGLGIFSPEKYPNDEIRLGELKDGAGYAGAADEAIQGLHPDGDLKDKSGAFLVALASGIAEIPLTEDGKMPTLVVTSMKDVGHFVVASLDLPKWERDMNIVGDCLTMGELLEIAVEVTGKRLEVEKLTFVELQKQQAELQPHQFMEQMWVELKLNYCMDERDRSILEPVVNRLCPKVKPVSVKEYLQTHWGSYQAEQRQV